MIIWFRWCWWWTLLHNHQTGHHICLDGEGEDDDDDDDDDVADFEGVANDGDDAANDDASMVQLMKTLA